jgi:hypothetical protein
MNTSISSKASPIQRNATSVSPPMSKLVLPPTTPANRLTSQFRPWQIVSYHAFIDDARVADFERYLKSGSGRAFAQKRLWPEGPASPE